MRDRSSAQIQVRAGYGDGDGDGISRDGDAIGEGNGDEELPDYATSQMEAHARRREEGVRRAAELQRRWRESRGMGRGGGGVGA